MPKRSILQAEQTDWYQPLDNSPSAWTMLKHLFLLLWQRLFASHQEEVVMTKLQPKLEKEKPNSRF